MLRNEVYVMRPARGDRDESDQPREQADIWNDCDAWEHFPFAPGTPRRWHVLTKKTPVLVADADVIPLGGSRGSFRQAILFRRQTSNAQ